jgi:hypothetical protein
MQRVTLNEVHDEVGREESENCPDETVSEDCYGSLRKFVFSETHLQSNIVGIKIALLSTARKTRSCLFMHRVQVDLSVKKTLPREPQQVYLQKHLEQDDWLKGKQTRVTLADFHT